MITQGLDTAEITASLDQFKRDGEYLMANYEGWLDLYSECWVVVYRERLVSRAATFEEAASAARKEGVAARCVIEYITREPHDMMLGSIICG